NAKNPNAGVKSSAIVTISSTVSCSNLGVPIETAVSLKKTRPNEADKKLIGPTTMRRVKLKKPATCTCWNAVSAKITNWALNIPSRLYGTLKAGNLRYARRLDQILSTRTVAKRASASRHTW